MALPHPMILNFSLPSGEDHIYSVNEIVTFQQVLDLIRTRCNESTAIAFDYFDEDGRNTVRSDQELVAMIQFYFEECQRRMEQEPFPLVIYPKVSKRPNLRVDKNAQSLPTGVRPGSGGSASGLGHSRRSSGPNLEELMQPEKISRDDLLFLEVLGYGNGGTVHRAMYQRAIVAVKVFALNVTQREQQQIMAELAVLHQCNSEYIIQFYGSFFNDNRISICTEYMDGGSLDKLGKIDEPVLGRMTVAVVKGLKYLWGLKIMHRDIKPSNMLVNTQGQVKLCDFGVSVQLEESLAKTFTGTNAYMSPERVMGDSYSFHSEIWSLGVSVVEMAIGRFPYPADGSRTGQLMANTPFELLQCIVHEPPPALSPEHFSAKFVNFCSQCLQKVPTARMAISSLMHHPFLAEMDDGNTELISMWVRQRLDQIKLWQQREREVQETSSPYLGNIQSSAGNIQSSAGGALPLNSSMYPAFDPPPGTNLPSHDRPGTAQTVPSQHPIDEPAPGWCG